MNLGLWLVGGIVGMAVLSVVARVAGVSGANRRDRPSPWLLVFSVVTFVVGMILLVIAARSGR